jgi:hypothetical protein
MLIMKVVLEFLMHLNLEVFGLLCIISIKRNGM